MDKRFIIALVLAAIVVLITPKLFPPAKAPAGNVPGADTTNVVPGSTSTVQPSPALTDTAGKGASPAATLAPSAPDSSAHPGATPGGPAALSVSTAPAETITVTTPKVVYRFSTVGATPVNAALRDYRSLAPQDGPVVVVRPSVPVLSYRLIAGHDTIPLDRTTFAADSTAAGAVGPLTFRTAVGKAVVAITYTFVPDSYVVRVNGTVSGVDPASMFLLLTLPRGLASGEADTLEDLRHLAYVVKPTRDDARSIAFGKLTAGQPQVENGPFDWVASKNKYFVVGVLTTRGNPPFTAATLHASAPTGKLVTTVDAQLVEPLTPQGHFGFEVYTGPQEWRRLLALGRDFEHVNPYGGIFRPVVQPFSTIVMQVLLWMHDRLRINYGWVVIIFGVVVRLILWPLNQSAMRSSIRLQRIQPELQALQKKYKNSPEKMHTEMMKLYQAHGMSPFSPVMGCLPMLLPMPVLFALFFVFQNTIEFRGVSFLWMSDISLADPYYILPVLMGISMFVLSWIGLRAAPPNPQAKMMAYVFPIMMTVFFFRLAAGLNLYYAVQNIAALPQQWVIAHERARSVVPTPAAASRGG